MPRRSSSAITQTGNAARKETRIYHSCVAIRKGEAMAKLTLQDF